MTKNKIKLLSKSELQEITYRCNSLADILRELGLYVSSGNYRPLKARLDDDNIDYKHIKLGLNANKGKTFSEKSKPLSELLVLNSEITSTKLKNKILKAKLLENKCSKCGQLPIWNGEDLTLQLDHINGNPRDNRLENLRILCPNCHTQTPTYGCKNNHPQKQYYCNCGAPVSSKGLSCRKCAANNPINHPTKIEWPPYEELKKMVEETNYTQVAKKLGVSDVSVKKRLNKSF